MRLNPILAMLLTGPLGGAGLLDDALDLQRHLDTGPELDYIPSAIRDEASRERVTKAEAKRARKAAARKLEALKARAARATEALGAKRCGEILHEVVLQTAPDIDVRDDESVYRVFARTLERIELELAGRP